MKQKIFNFIFIFLSISSLFFIFSHNQEVAKTIIDAVNIFFKRVFVSLFPMFILNDIFIYLNFPGFFSKLFSPFFKIFFHTNGTCAYVFFMSLLSGTPSNAYILKEMVEQKQISVQEANHDLMFTYFSNPLFLFTMLSLIFPISTTIKIIIIHYTSNIIIGFLIRKKAFFKEESLEFKQQHFSLASSIKKTMNTLLMILGAIVFFMLVSYIFTAIIPLPFVVEILGSGFLEITNGLNRLINPAISIKLKEIMAVFIISFGGLSIHTQIEAILEDSPISYFPFLKGRILQTIISTLLILIF